MLSADERREMTDIRYDLRRQVAENCGTSVRMIEKTYAKILAEKRREFIERGTPSLARGLQLSSTSSR